MASRRPHGAALGNGHTLGKLVRPPARGGPQTRLPPPGAANTPAAGHASPPRPGANAITLGRVPAKPFNFDESANSPNALASCANLQERQGNRGAAREGTGAIAS